MKIVCIKKFRDKTSAKKIQDQKIIKVGEILDCKDELATERINGGFAKKYEEVATQTSTENDEEKKSNKKK